LNVVPALLADTGVFLRRL